jgi:hypothetical protein
MSSNAQFEVVLGLESERERERERRGGYADRQTKKHYLLIHT